MGTIEKKKLSAKEMALPYANSVEADFFAAAIRDVNDFPPPKELSYQWDLFSAGKSFDSNSIQYFVDRIYPRIWESNGHLIEFLQQNLWELRDTPEELVKYILEHPVAVWNDKYDPQRSSNPVRQSLQNIKNVFYTHSGPGLEWKMWSLMRPELLRQINELMAITKNVVLPQRPYTPRSLEPTAGPSLGRRRAIIVEDDKNQEFARRAQTTKTTILKEILEGSDVWKVTVSVLVKGGSEERVFVDYFDSVSGARESKLLTQAKKLTPEQYVTEFADYEVK